MSDARHDFCSLAETPMDWKSQRLTTKGGDGLISSFWLLLLPAFVWLMWNDVFLIVDSDCSAWLQLESFENNQRG